MDQIAYPWWLVPACFSAATSAKFFISRGRTAFTAAALALINAAVWLLAALVKGQFS